MAKVRRRKFLAIHLSIPNLLIGDGRQEKTAEIDMEFIPPVEWTGKLPKEVLREFREAKKIDDYLKHPDQLDKVEKDAREFFSAGPGSR